MVITKDVTLENNRVYTITSDGEVYAENGMKIKTRVKRSKGRSPSVVFRIQYPNSRKQTMKYVAGLVADLFVPNPNGFTRKIFKDRDPTNCKASNIAWVDNETFMQYCGEKIYGGAKKGTGNIVNTQDYAISKCQDDRMKKFYQSLNNNDLHAVWFWIDSIMANYHLWEEVAGEVYLYFHDRALRFSIIRPPLGLVYTRYLWEVRKIQRSKTYFIADYWHLAAKTGVEHIERTG